MIMEGLVLLVLSICICTSLLRDGSQAFTREEVMHRVR